jgi:hypothetical protein
VSGLVLVGSFSEARYDPFYRLEDRRLGKKTTDNASDRGGLGGFEGLRGSVDRRVANVITVGQEAIRSFGELSGKKSSQPIDGSS